jgi:hypothetical protein
MRPPWPCSVVQRRLVLRLVVLYAAILVGATGGSSLHAWGASTTALCLMGLHRGVISPSLGLAALRGCALLPIVEILQTQQREQQWGPAAGVLAVTFAGSWWVAEDLRWREARGHQAWQQAVIAELRSLGEPDATRAPNEASLTRPPPPQVTEHTGEQDAITDHPETLPVDTTGRRQATRRLFPLARPPRSSRSLR